MLEYLQAFDNCIRFVLNKTKCWNSCETWDLLLYNKPMKTTPYLSPLDFCCLCGWIPTWAYLGPSCSGASRPWGFWEGQRIARPSGLQPQWHHGSSLGSRWMGGRRGVMGGKLRFFHPKMGKKIGISPWALAEWNGLVFFFVPWQRVSWVTWIGKNGRCNGARYCRKQACLL